jgi:hypothetical protein
MTGAREQRLSLHFRWHARAQKIQYRGSELDQFQRPVHSFRKFRGARRPMHDQGNMHGALINKESMHAFAVIAQPFAMIGGEDQKRAVKQLAIRKKFPEASQSFVDIGEFTVVGGAVKSLLKLARQIVRSVQVVEVQENEKGRGRVFVNPLACRLDDILGGPLEIAGVAPRIQAEIERAVVVVESLIQSKPAIEREAADECRSPVTRRFQLCSERDRSGRELFAVIRDPGSRWIPGRK